MTERYDAVIFDLFGTLADNPSVEEADRACRAVADALVLPHDAFREAWRASMPERDIGAFGGVEGDLRDVCRRLGQSPVPARIEAATRLRLALYRRYLAPRDGAVETLTQLRARGLRIGLISNCANEIPRLWGEAALAPLIDYAIFSSEAGMEKPDERIYRMVCSRLEVAPERCLYVGDGSSFELSGAQRVGMTSVLICTPYERESVMRKAEPRGWTGPVIEHLSEVFKYFEEAV